MHRNDSAYAAANGEMPCVYIRSEERRSRVAGPEGGEESQNTRAVDPGSGDDGSGVGRGATHGETWMVAITRTAPV